MSLLVMAQEVAENIGVLSEDFATIIDGTVTSAGIKRKINDLYRDELFTLLSDKYPADFIMEDYPAYTYTATGVVDAATVTTTLVATTAIFDNTMEGFQLQNVTTPGYCKIVKYINTTTVTVDVDVTTWIGATIYVLGNEYQLGAETDLKEILSVQVKYQSTNPMFSFAQMIKQKDFQRTGPLGFNATAPRWYLTRKTVTSVSTLTVGIAPYPSNYDGQFIVTKIQKPPVLTDNMEPQLAVAGISQILVNGVTAWAFRLQKRYDDAQQYAMLYEKGKLEMLMNYKPTTRQGSTRIKLKAPFKW